MCWINFAALSTNGWFITSSETEIILRVQTNGTFDYILNDFTTNDRASSAAGAIVVGRWYHLIGSYDGTDIKIYIDGHEIASATPTGNYTEGPTWLIQNNQVGRANDFSMLDLRWYDRGFTPAEAFEAFSPASRWDLYWQRHLFQVKVPVAVAVPIVNLVMAPYTPT